jgi:putative endonuclease
MPRCSRAEAQRRRERKRAMKYVYILQSEIAPDRYYVGSTVDLKRRLSEHNDGHSIHTNKFKPWRLKTYLAFEDHAKADAFEAFLKTGNGRVFTKKRL